MHYQRCASEREHGCNKYKLRRKFRGFSKDAAPEGKAAPYTNHTRCGQCRNGTKTCITEVGILVRDALEIDEGVEIDEEVEIKAICLMENMKGRLKNGEKDRSDRSAHLDGSPLEYEELFDETFDAASAVILAPHSEDTVSKHRKHFAVFAGQKVDRMEVLTCVRKLLKRFVPDLDPTENESKESPSEESTVVQVLLRLHAKLTIKMRLP